MGFLHGQISKLSNQYISLLLRDNWFFQVLACYLFALAVSFDLDSLDLFIHLINISLYFELSLVLLLALLNSIPAPPGASPRTTCAAEPTGDGSAKSSSNERKGNRPDWVYKNSHPGKWEIHCTPFRTLVEWGSINWMGFGNEEAEKGGKRRGRDENYIWSDTNFLEKRKTSYVGSSRSRNVAVARPKPVNKTDPDPSGDGSIANKDRGAADSQQANKQLQELKPKALVT